MYCGLARSGIATFPAHMGGSADSSVLCSEYLNNAVSVTETRGMCVIRVSPPSSRRTRGQGQRRIIICTCAWDFGLPMTSSVLRRQEKIPSTASRRQTCSLFSQQRQAMHRFSIKYVIPLMRYFICRYSSCTLWLTLLGARGSTGTRPRDPLLLSRMYSLSD